MMLQMQPASCGKKALRSKTLELETTQFGKIEIDEDKIITMHTDMPGFPGKKRFIILEQESTKPFCWFQSIDEHSLALTLINPYLFKPDYAVNFKSILKEMNWQEDGKENLSMYVVVNAANKTPEKITANLIAPLLINTQKYQAVQLVLYDSAYSHKHFIFGQQGT